MNGPHDLGGAMGFGPVQPEPGEPLFHAEWEARALGLVLACGALGYWTLDENRHARESLHPAIYYSASYYEIWTRALEALLLHHGLITPEELVQGIPAAPASAPADPHPRQLRAERVAAVLAKGGPADRPVQTPARFAPGDRVRTKRMHPKTHTRLPRYLTGHNGVIEADRGGFVLPDTNAHGLGEQPQRVYTVVFSGDELWGESAEPGTSVSADLWEGYLEHA